jgi:hypothetical protein
VWLRWALGHTTAHLTCITDVELQELARNFGDDHAQAAWDAGAAAIDEIQKIVQDEQIMTSMAGASGRTTK